MALEHEQEFEYVKLETMKNVTVVFQQAQKTGNVTMELVQVCSKILSRPKAYQYRFLFVHTFLNVFSLSYILRDIGDS